MLEDRIEKWVIINLVLADGTKVDFEMSDGTEENVVAFEVVDVIEYEENGYEVEGLELVTLSENEVIENVEFISNID